MTDADLLQALRDCYDPILRRNIVDLNLVRSAYLEIDNEAPGASIAGVPPRYCAHITLVSPTSDDTSNAQLLAQVQNRLLGMQQISHADVRLLPPAFTILNARNN